MQDAMVFDEQDMNDSNVYVADNRLFVKFYKKAVQNSSKSAEAGRPIFDEVDYVKIIVPGDKNTVLDTPVTDEYRHRFEARWEKYQKGQEQAQEGTPLEAVTWLTVGQVAELKALNIFSVDQLAEVPDQLAQRFMGCHELRRKAKAFIESAKGEAATTKLAKELEDRDMKIAALQAQMDQLIAAQAKAAPPTEVAKKA